MYRFSYVETVGGKAREVTREIFYEIIRLDKIKTLCKQIADLGSSPTREGQVGALKRQLPAFCWHAWFDDGKRKNSAAHPSGLVMIDVDHVDNPRELWEKLKDKSLELKVVVAHITPSTKGLRLVFPVPQGMDIVQAQTYYVNALNLKNVDVCTKDLARLSFCVPEEYFLYINVDALFNPSQDLINNQELENLRINPGNEKDDKGGNFPNFFPLVRGSKGQVSQEFKEELQENIELSPSLNAHTGKADNEHSVDESATNFSNSLILDKKESTFQGIEYSCLVECLEELLGGRPEHGSRNNFIFTMAAYLRYVCNDDPDWIASILPTYGEDKQKWRRTIDSACQRAQYKVMPTIVHRAIENARKRASSNDNDDDNDNQKPPEMPKRLPKLIAHLVKNVPEVCKPAVANAVFPALAAHLHGVKFWLIDGTEKEATFMCVTMARQSSGKASVNKPIEYIVADIVERDEINRRREQEWKDATAQKGANKEKPKRPEDLCVQVLVSDMTNAAFVQRMKDAGERYLYTNLEELDLLKQLQTNGTKDIGKIICLCFDNGKYGQERVGTQSVTARVDLRWNWNASSTIQKGIDFFKGRLVDGTLSRVNFCTIIPDKTKPFVYGRYDEQYAETLKPFITNLNLATGYIECKQALSLARKLLDKCQDEAALTDNDVYQDMAFRAVTIAYLKAMVLYIANDMKWTKDIADFTDWSLRYDLWCKNHFFGEKVSEEKAKESQRRRRGPQNLLNLLPDQFTLQDASDIRRQAGMDDNGTKVMISAWMYRGYVEQDQAAKLYFKTEKYKRR